MVTSAENSKIVIENSVVDLEKEIEKHDEGKSPRTEKTGKLIQVIGKTVNQEDKKQNVKPSTNMTLRARRKEPQEGLQEGRTPSGRTDENIDFEGFNEDSRILINTKITALTAAINEERLRKQKDICVKCAQVVTKRQQALKCDQCLEWQHRKCQK